MSRAAKDTFRSENKVIYFFLKINNPNIMVKVIGETTHFIIKMNFEESLPWATVSSTDVHCIISSYLEIIGKQFCLFLPKDMY